MPVTISLPRAVNVGGRQVNKETLIAIHKVAGCIDPKTFIASGNLIFTTNNQNLEDLKKRIEKEFYRATGFQSEAILRKEKEIEGSKLLLTFLAAKPKSSAVVAALSIATEPEEMHILGREIYTYFPNGQGPSKFPGKNLQGTPLGFQPASNLMQEKV